MTDSVIQVAMIEPYQMKNPMTTGGEAYYHIWFDTANGKIVGIETTLSQDCFEKVDGEWVTKETVLEIPAEINGIKVKSIGSHVAWRKSSGAIGSFDHIYFPDDIVLEDFAFASTGDVSATLAGTLHFGDNTVIGYAALPDYKAVEKGENVIYKGKYLDANYPSSLEEVLYDTVWNDVLIRHCDTEDIQVEEGYSGVLYRCGNNIQDRVPTKTLTLSKDVVYVDPRVGWLNRKYVVDEENPNFTTIDGVLYNKDMTKLISVPIGVESIEIPDTVTEIGEFAFSYCNAIEEITVPASVTTIGNRAFWHLSNLKRVWFEGEIPETYSPKLCGEFQTICLLEAAAERLSYTVESNETIRFKDIPQDGTPFAAFYDMNGELLSLKSGTDIEIPTYAKSYDLYIWNENLKPLTFKESGEL